MFDEHTIVKKGVSLFEWKNNTVSHYPDSPNQMSNKNQNYSKLLATDLQYRTGEGIIKLFFCPVSKKDQETLISVNMNGGVGEMLLDPKTKKISIINLFKNLSCHTLDCFETYNGFLPVHISCVYEKDSDSLKIYLIDETKCKNLTSDLANEDYFGHDIILDFDKNDRICAIEVLDASEYLTSINNE